jgi:hypothetical protein
MALTLLSTPAMRVVQPEEQMASTFFVTDSYWSFEVNKGERREGRRREVAGRKSYMEEIQQQLTAENFVGTVWRRL